MITGLEHTGLEVPNVEPVLGFYVKVFGMKVLLDKELPPGGRVRRLLFLEGQGFILEFLEVPEAQITDNYHICFEVSSMSRAIEELKALGMEPTEPVRPSNPRSNGVSALRVIFAGPLGEKLEFMGPE